MEQAWQVAGDQGGRHYNADAAASYRTADGRLVFALADGIGDTPIAARAARVAAAAAVRAAGGPRASIAAARAAVLAEAGGDCVLVVAEATGSGYRVAWVGDARAYAWNGVEVWQLTKDHTVGQYFADRGVAVAPRLSHVVTSSVRTLHEVGEVDTYQPGGLLLMTDGVYRGVGLPRIGAILRGASEPAAALVNAAVGVGRVGGVGGVDNATALVVHGVGSHAMVDAA
ncbi:PP2C family protein-serine/threonine phosphatase [Actinokineospora enzanensis]|uniref:PP2C family protein-serine/threonine phosphatase n=1 Tax=Actinokineospora enzanensis TaxID=155975 RepID=UPI00037B6BD0|nr:hypothetical protein [Actinokineospora enzanensis]